MLEFVLHTSHSVTVMQYTMSVIIMYSVHCVTHCKDKHIRIRACTACTLCKYPNRTSWTVHLEWHAAREHELYRLCSITVIKVWPSRFTYVCPHTKLVHVWRTSTDCDPCSKTDRCMFATAMQWNLLIICRGHWFIANEGNVFDLPQTATYVLLK